jgi:hypothetical protein
MATAEVVPCDTAAITQYGDGEPESEPPLKAIGVLKSQPEAAADMTTTNWNFVLKLNLIRQGPNVA